MQSTSEYLEASWGISEYLGDLDLANGWRLTRRWVWVWIVESSSVWGNVWSVVETECVWSLETEIFRWRGWNLEVSPNKLLLFQHNCSYFNLPHLFQGGAIKRVQDIMWVSQSRPMPIKKKFFWLGSQQEMVQFGPEHQMRKFLNNGKRFS